MRQVDPMLGELLAVAAGAFSPGAGVGVSYAVKVVNRLIAAHGEHAQLTREQVLDEARRMLDEGLPDAATAAGEVGFHLVDDDGA